MRAFAGPSGARDLIIDMEVNADPWQPSAVVHRDPGEDPYLVLQMAAPATVAAGDVSRKDVTVVIDRSGSMTGAPMDQACAAGELVVRRLRRGDRVNVIAFDHTVDPLFTRPQPVETARDAALQFIKRIRAGGGTNIAAALDMERVRDIMTEVVERAAAIVRRYGVVRAQVDEAADDCGLFTFDRKPAWIRGAKRTVELTAHPDPFAN